MAMHDSVYEWGIYYPSSILQPCARPPFFYDGGKHRTPGRHPRHQTSERLRPSSSSRRRTHAQTPYRNSCTLRV